MLIQRNNLIPSRLNNVNIDLHTVNGGVEGRSGNATMVVILNNYMGDDGKPPLIPYQLPVILKRPKRSKKTVFSSHTISVAPARNRIVRYNEDNRIMSKSGRIHVRLNNIRDKSSRYVRDLWNTLVNMRWRWILFTVALVNVAAYLIFAGFFLLDAWVSGDFDQIPDHKICIRGVHNFTSFFMLGIETITTTGYGYFHPTEYCQLVWVVLTFSTLVTIFIDGAFISVVYVKISRPTYKISKGLFSKKAVIMLRNGKLCLVFRVNDRMGKHRINSQIKLFLVKSTVSHEGELLPNHITELKLDPYGVLFWPIEIVHVITPQSPLWNVSARDLMTVRFELLATVVGNSVLTGQSSLSQTSYLSEAILWGYWFSPCVEYSNDKQEYIVNKKNFNKTLALDSPLCSAHHLNDVEREIRRRRLSVDCLHLSSDQETGKNLQVLVP